MSSFGEIGTDLRMVHDKLQESADQVQIAAGPIEHAHALLSDIYSAHSTSGLDEAINLQRSAHDSVGTTLDILLAVSKSLGTIATRLGLESPGNLAVSKPNRLPEPAEPSEDETLGFGPFRLLRRSEVASILGINTTSVKYAEPYMPKLNILDRTLRFPSTYAEALKSSGLVSPANTRQASRDFSGTNAASVADQVGRIDFEVRLRDNFNLEPEGLVTRQQAATVLDISEATITNMCAQNLLRTLMRNNRNDPLLITERSLRQIFWWEDRSS